MVAAGMIHSRLAKTSADAVKEILEHQHQNYLI
jgi:hypothetical protein